MNKEELRLAVVIYGGASLAVYMHGVTKELFRLVQASKRVRDALQDPAAAPAELPPLGPGSSTANIYADLLLRMNKTREFRVVIDVVAGASAGAINGAMLSKAIAQDLPLEAQTEMWLEKADVDYLGEPTRSAWARWYLFPFLKGFIRLLPPKFRSNAETQRKLEKFMRLAWLAPPLSGPRLCHILLDALQRVGAENRAGASLLPPGQRLDYYASITDLFGYPRSFRLNESTVAHEQEHAVVARLMHLETEQGRAVSDFQDANDPALVWAARASSSYAGAFAPFHHSELLEVLAQRDQKWDAEQFLKRKILLRDAQPAHDVFDPGDRYFLDGGIVNNKPFAAALEALHHRPADRNVDRCILYIEPLPNQQDAKDPQRFFRYLGTIRAAISSIPRNQPILSELNEVAERDAHARINQRLVDSNRDKIDGLVAARLATQADSELTAESLRDLREYMHDSARSQMGIAFDAYTQRRVWRLAEALVDQWRALSPGIETQETELAMMASIERWLEQEPDERQRDPQATFLERFDVIFRIRRLQFVIRSLNQRFAHLNEDSNDGDAIGALKQSAYETLQTLYRLRRTEGLDKKTLAQIAAAGKRLPLPQREAIGMLRLLSRALRLPALDRQTDASLCRCCAAIENEKLRVSIIADYTGFAQYDVLFTAAGSEMRDADPLTRLRLERISPEDSPGLQAHFKGLRSKDLMSFAGFFNRGYREHDYLWGRLNGADRIVDLLSNAAGELLSEPQQRSMRLALFNAIVGSERNRLKHCRALLDRLTAELDREAERTS